MNKAKNHKGVLHPNSRQHRQPFLLVFAVSASALVNSYHQLRKLSEWLSSQVNPYFHLVRVVSPYLSLPGISIFSGLCLHLYSVNITRCVRLSPFSSTYQLCKMSSSINSLMCPLWCTQVHHRGHT